MKASRVAADQAKSLANLSLLVMALCEKQGVDVDKVLGTVEPQTREEMKAYATKLPAPIAVAPAVESTPPASVVAKATPAKSKQSKSK